MKGTTAAEVAADIERRVADGVFAPGHRLPPVRTLAAELDLAPNTVAAAYRRLGERGIVVGRGRSGTFVAGSPPVAPPPEPSVGEGLVDLARGNPDPALLPLFPVSSLGQGTTILYGDESFDPGLRARSADSLGTDGVDTSHMTVVSGALDGLERILGAHLRAGDRVVVEDPAFYSVVDLIGALGLVPVPVPIDDAGLQPEPLSEALDGGVAAVVHTPRAQNPFGSALTVGRASDLRTVLASHAEVLVVEDDYAAEISGAPYRTLVDDRPAWAVIRSAAKSYGPDLRVATVAADPITVRRVEGRQRLGPGWISHVLQRATAALMAHPDIRATLASTTETYSGRRQALLDALRGRGIAAHGASGLNVWAPVHDEAAVVEGMRARGYAVRAGERFRLRTGPGVRITTASLPEAEAAAVAGALAETIGEQASSTRIA